MKQTDIRYGSRNPELEYLYNSIGLAGRVVVHEADHVPDGFEESRGLPEAIAPATASRKAEFSAGRQLAQLCLEMHKRPNETVGRGPDREPVWPEGITGSITHTDRFLAAVACEVAAGDVLGVGIDAERLGNLEEEVYETVFTVDEMTLLNRSAVSARDLLATCMFSAKEALFKAQFPITGSFVDFPEVTLIPQPTEEPSRGFLEVRHQTPVLQPLKFSLFYCQFDDTMVTGAIATDKN